MHASLLLTFLSLFFTLTFAAPTPLHNTLSTIPTIEADTAYSLPIPLIAAEPKTYGTFLHIADSALHASEAILDLSAVEAAKEAIKERLQGEPEVEREERSLRFRGGAKRPRVPTAEAVKVERAF